MPPGEGEAPSNHVSAAAVNAAGRVETPRFQLAGLGLFEWTNIIFTIVAIAGGLFCAFYFFNGTELLRTAGRWPQEYLCPRPRSNEDAMTERLRLAESLGLPTLPGVKADARNSGDPFSRTSGLLSLQPPNSFRSAPGGPTNSGGTSGSPASTGASPPGLPRPNSLLAGLGRPAPGGDDLTRGFTSAVDDLQKAGRLNARRTVTVVHNRVTRMERRLSKRTKSTAGIAHKTARRAAHHRKALVGRLPRSRISTNLAISTVRPGVASATKGVSGATSSATTTRAAGLRGSRSSRQGLGSLGGGRAGVGGIGGHGHR